MIHRIVLFLKFAPSSEDFNRTFMDIDLIVPLWNRKKNKTSVDGQTFKVCGFKRSYRAKFLL